MNIKVSIIIPAYNVAQYIEKCLLSIINQTLEEIEIIVVNDGSTDNTLKIITRISDKDSRIKIINKDNGGLSSARNAGIQIAKGEYIQHLDGDDWFEFDGCEKLYNFAKENNLDLLVLDYLSETKNANVILVKDNLPPNIIFKGNEYLNYFFDDNSRASVCSKFIKRNLYKGILHPESVALGEDLATTPRLALRALRIAKMDDAFLHYTYNDTSITRNKFGTKMYQLFLVFDIIREDFFKLNQLKDFEKQITALETLRINAFLVMPPYWNDENYMRGFNLVLNFFKKNKIIPKKINFIKKIILRSLMCYPNKYNLISAIIFLNFISKINSKIRG